MTADDMTKIEAGRAQGNAEPIDGARYFQQLMDDAVQRGLLSDEEAAATQMQLWGLLRKQIERYMMGDSSSVRVEMAKMLLRSVCWCIGTYLFRQGDAAMRQLKTETLAVLFDSGLKAVKEDVARGRLMLRALQRMSIGVRNRAYRDTVFDALPAFFKRYDTAFFADETPCAIDYQLCMPMTEVGGVVYINAYMRRMMQETAFFRAFDAALTGRLMRTFGPDYEEMLINIFEPVFAGAVGLALLGGDVCALVFTAQDRAILMRALQGLDMSALACRVSHAVREVCDALGIVDPTMKAYLRSVQEQFVPRLFAQLAQGDISALFLSLGDVRESGRAPVYEDGETMPDERLRDLIDEMRDCRFVSDKITMIVGHIRSICDLALVIGECFIDDEWAQVFDALDDPSMAALWRYLYSEKGDDFLERDGNLPWENAFADYVRRMDSVRQERIRQGCGE